MMNGYAMYGTYNPTSGNGNGFKMGSSKTGVRHLVQNNVAWKNKASGFYANHSTGGNTWYNNTSFMNGTNYNMLASSFDSSGNVVMTITLTGALAHIMRNNIGYPNKNANMDGVDTMFNTWDLNITPASSDFASISDPSVSMTGMQIEGMGALGPRAGRRQPAERRLHAPLRGEPDDRQGDRRGAALRRRGARSRRLRVRRDDWWDQRERRGERHRRQRGSGRDHDHGNGRRGERRGRGGDRRRRGGAGGTGAGGTTVTGTGGSGTGGFVGSGGSTGTGGAATGAGGTGTTGIRR